MLTKGKTMLNTNAEMIQAIKSNTDAFMAFSNIFISSIERLTMLNLSTTRISLEESAAAAALMVDSNASVPSSKAKRLTSVDMSENAAAYFRSVREIATDAQQETTKLMTTYLARQGNGSSQHAGWLKGFDAFNNFGQNFSAFADANRKALTDVTSRVANQTNAHSRKSA